MCILGSHEFSFSMHFRTVIRSILRVITSNHELLNEVLSKLVSRRKADGTLEVGCVYTDKASADRVSYYHEKCAASCCKIAGC